MHKIYARGLAVIEVAAVVFAAPWGVHADTVIASSPNVMMPVVQAVVPAAMQAATAANSPVQAGLPADDVNHPAPPSADPPSPPNTPPNLSSFGPTSKNSPSVTSAPVGNQPFQAAPSPAVLSHHTAHAHASGAPTGHN